MRPLQVITVFLLSFAVSAVAQQRTDHPLLTGYPGSKITKKEVKDFDEQTMLLSAIDKDGKYKSERLEGRVTRMNYDDPSGRSVLEKYRN